MYFARFRVNRQKKEKEVSPFFFLIIFSLSSLFTLPAYSGLTFCLWLSFNKGFHHLRNTG